MTSREEGFAAWLAMNDYLVEDDFLVFDVDDMPDDPFTEDGLRVAERAALGYFADMPAVLAPENRELFDKFMRYVGETFVRGLGFSWTNKPTAGDDGKAHILVEHRGIDTQLNPPRMITVAAGRRTGDEWAFVYRNMRERLDAWRS